MVLLQFGPPQISWRCLAHAGKSTRWLSWRWSKARRDTRFNCEVEGGKLKGGGRVVHDHCLETLLISCAFRPPHLRGSGNDHPSQSIAVPGSTVGESVFPPDTPPNACRQTSPTGRSLPVGRGVSIANSSSQVELVVPLLRPYCLTSTPKESGLMETPSFQNRKEYPNTSASRIG